MKKTIILIFAVLTLSFYMFSEVKVGVINAQDVVAKTKKGSKLQQKLEAKYKAKQELIKKKQEELKGLEKELSSPALNTETRSKKKRSFEDKRIALQRMVEDAQKEMQMETQRELMNLQKEVMPLIQEIGKAKGYTLILDMANSGIAYFDATIDITPDVIKAVDAKFPN